MKFLFVQPGVCPPTSQFPSARADNVPLNPSQPPTKIAPFDPLGALAGMTGSIGESLSSNRKIKIKTFSPSGMNANPAMMSGGPGFNPAMGGPDGMGMEGMGPVMGGPMDGMSPMNNQFNNMGPMMGGGPPRPGFPPGGMGPGMARMMGRPPMGAGMYNGNPNVQVKQTAPNTIQVRNFFIFSNFKWILSLPFASSICHRDLKWGLRIHEVRPI